MERFLIFLKENDIVPIRLEDTDFGVIAQNLMQQGFIISPIQVTAGNSQLAIQKYKKSLAMHISLQLKEITSPILM